MCQKWLNTTEKHFVVHTQQPAEHRVCTDGADQEESVEEILHRGTIYMRKNIVPRVQACWTECVTATLLAKGVLLTWNEYLQKHERVMSKAIAHTEKKQSKAVTHKKSYLCFHLENCTTVL